MISIIIPTYEEEGVIGNTIKHLRQYKGPHEIIISDDKSHDKTVEEARGYADVVLVPEVKHPTIGANKNYGAKMAKGDILVFLDSDSVVVNPNDFFEKALKRFAEDKELVGITAKLNVSPEVETLSDKLMYVIFNFVTLVKNNVLHSGEAPGKIQIIRKEAFLEVGGYREDLVAREDGIMFNRLAKIGKTLYDSSLQVFYSGDRAHAIGWIRLLSIWMINTFWVALFNKSFSKNWLQPKKKN